MSDFPVLLRRLWDCQLKRCPGIRQVFGFHLRVNSCTGAIALQHCSDLFQTFCGRFDKDNHKYSCSLLRWQHGTSDDSVSFSGFLHNSCFFLFLIYSVFFIKTEV